MSSSAVGPSGGKHLDRCAPGGDVLLGTGVERVAECRQLGEDRDERVRAQPEDGAAGRLGHGADDFEIAARELVRVRACLDPLLEAVDGLRDPGQSAAIVRLENTLEDGAGEVTAHVQEIAGDRAQVAAAAGELGDPRQEVRTAGAAEVPDDVAACPAHREHARRSEPTEGAADRDAVDVEPAGELALGRQAGAGRELAGEDGAPEGALAGLHRRSGAIDGAEVH